MSVTEAALRTSEAGVGPVDERPLTDDERRAVIRLLSDPFIFPQPFKTWLVSYLEGSDLSLPISAINGLVTLLGITGGSGGGGTLALLPAGSIFPYAGTVAPGGALLCRGQEVSRDEYSRLFGVISTIYGDGNGSSTFNVPDLQGRIPVGRGTHPDVDTLNDNEGMALGARRPRHKHTVVQPTISVPVISHGLTLPNHKHALTDPGHKHASPGSANIATFNSGNSEIPSGDGPINRSLDTDTKTTGITVENPSTLPAIPGAITSSAPTASGGTVGPQTGNEPTDGAAFLTVNFIIVT